MLCACVSRNFWGLCRRQWLVDLCFGANQLKRPLHRMSVLPGKGAECTHTLKRTDKLAAPKCETPN